MTRPFCYLPRYSRPWMWGRSWTRSSSRGIYYGNPYGFVASNTRGFRVFSVGR